MLSANLYFERWACLNEHKTQKCHVLAEGEQQQLVFHLLALWSSSEFFSVSSPAAGSLCLCAGFTLLHQTALSHLGLSLCRSETVKDILDMGKARSASDLLAIQFASEQQPGSI